MSTKKRLLAEMPSEFNRQDWMDKISETSFSYSYANQLINEAIFSGDLERVERGKYRKVEPELETA